MNKNAILLRAFINEVQETGFFNHPAMINLVKNHRAKRHHINHKKSPSIVTQTPDNSSTNSPSFTSPSQPLIVEQNNNYGVTIENPSLNQSSFSSPFLSSPEIIINYINSSSESNNFIDNKSSQKVNKLSEFDRTKRLLQKYIKYVRETGDCEYPPLEKNLAELGLIPSLIDRKL